MNDAAQLSLPLDMAPTAHAPNALRYSAERASERALVAYLEGIREKVAAESFDRHDAPTANDY